MDRFTEVYELQAAGALLTALGLGEKSICEVDRLNMGLYMLGNIITKAADKIEEDEIYNDFEAFLDDINNILGIQGGSYVK